LAEARLHELLAFEGGLVLTVLAQVTQLDGFADLLRKSDVQLVLEALCLCAECFF